MDAPRPRPPRRPAPGKAIWLASVLLDTGPVLFLAGLAAAGSFTHIRDTAIAHGQTGWMAWAIAVCIDLTCVMAARERQRDARIGRRHRRRISWPTLVLAAGITLSLAANLAQAERSPWGWITAGTPAACFLIAVSMLERRAGTLTVDEPRTQVIDDGAPGPLAGSPRPPAEDPNETPTAPVTRPLMPAIEALSATPPETPTETPPETPVGAPFKAPAGGPGRDPAQTSSGPQPHPRFDAENGDDSLGHNLAKAPRPRRQRSRRDAAIRTTLAGLANNAERIRYAADQLGAEATPAKVRGWLGNHGVNVPVSAAKSALRRRSTPDHSAGEPAKTQ